MSLNVGPRPAPSHYTLAQILLHWTIAALVIWQLVFGEDMSRLERVTRRGGSLDAETAFFANSHIWAGFAILALIVLRVWLRLSRGTPAPDEPNPVLRRAANGVHAAFYVLLFLMPVTGILTYYFEMPLGDVHGLGKPLFIILIALHVVAALWHQFIRRDGGLLRMVVPAR